MKTEIHRGLSMRFPLSNSAAWLPWALAWVATAASAQTSWTEPAKSRGSVLSELQYVSAFRNYQPYADQPVQPWREANDRVGQIGGWRVYAREAAMSRSKQESPVTDFRTGAGEKVKP